MAVRPHTTEMAEDGIKAANTPDKPKKMVAMCMLMKARVRVMGAFTQVYRPLINRLARLRHNHAH